MTRRDLIHKWSCYALALFAVWVMDLCVLPRYPLFGLTPMLLPLAAAAVSELEGARAGAGFGLAVGLVWALAYPGGLGWRVFGMTLAGMAVGAAAQYVLSQNFFSCLLCSGVVLGVLDGLQLIRALFIRLDTLDVLLRVAVPEVLLSLCWTPAVYALFHLIYRRVGGTRLA